MNEIAFYLIDSGNGRHIRGVPKRNLTRAEFEALPGHIQKSVRASSLYAAAEDVDGNALLEFTAAADEEE